MDETSRDGRFQILRLTFERQLAIHAFAAMPATHLMVALLELDVTVAIAAIDAQRRQGKRLSLFSYMVHAIAAAISEHPDLNLVCHGRRLARFEDVDVSVPVEVSTPAGHFPRQVVLRCAHRRTAGELYADLEAARGRFEKQGAVGAEDKWYRRTMGLLRWVPGFVRTGLLRLFMRSAFRIKRSAGTTLVTSVGKFAAIPGFAFSFTTGPRAAAFAVGGVVEKPWLHDGQMQPRSVLSLSVMVNHDLVDGAPAARFARRLKDIIESAEGL
jgi:pyruvate/2-oxoglutarate dehydrogenase complex dihydrolipoamide acyltransferase (E2) component